MKKVAIITRTKNRTLLLERAILSVLNQKFQDWVHVIVNDGGVSADVDTVINRYRAQYQDRIIVVHNPESTGMEAASNIGIKSSDSEYVMIHDDDDSLDPEFLSTCINFFNSNKIKSIKGVVTHTRTVREVMKNNSVEIVGSHSFDPWLNSITLPALSEVNKFMPISFLYERSAFDTVGLYDESLPVIGDWEFNLRFLMKFDIMVIKQELANYHIRESSDGAYSNTVTAGKDRHELYRSLVINNTIRKSETNEGLKLAFLLMQGDYSYRISSGVWRLNLIIDRLKNNKIMKLAKKFL